MTLSCTVSDTLSLLLVTLKVFFIFDTAVKIIGHVHFPARICEHSLADRSTRYIIRGIRFWKMSNSWSDHQGQWSLVWCHLIGYRWLGGSVVMASDSRLDPQVQFPADTTNTGIGRQTTQATQANSAFYHQPDGKRIPAKVRWCSAAWRLKASMVHSTCG